MDGYTYTGAPDECSIHWPTKLVNGCCPEPDCPWNDPVHEKNKEDA